MQFSVPRDAFVHTQAEAVVTLTATRLSGAALPGWLSFNPQTGAFAGTPPPGLRGELQIRITARDNEGHQAVQTITIRIGEGQRQNTSQPNLDGLQRHAELPDLRTLAVQDAQLVKPVKEVVQAGRASLSEQFARHGKAAAHAQRDVLVQRAARLAQLQSGRTS